MNVRILLFLTRIPRALWLVLAIVVLTAFLSFPSPLQVGESRTGDEWPRQRQGGGGHVWDLPTGMTQSALMESAAH